VSAAAAAAVAKQHGVSILSSQLISYDSDIVTASSEFNILYQFRYYLLFWMMHGKLNL